MKRSPLLHERVFNNEDYAEQYAHQHWKMAKRFGQECAQKLAARGFQAGRIIDVGCGSGATNLVLAERFVGSEVAGIDLSEPLLQLARQAAAGADMGERVRFEKADVQQIPYEDGMFDAAINVNMVHLVENPIGMLDEIERVLAPDGFLFVADLRRSWLGFVEGEIRSALTLGEARELFHRSRLREGALSWGLLWWRFEA
jgi:ubiquinone/menaquinone biosynthesis C-methylase UbiE